MSDHIIPPFNSMNFGRVKDVSVIWHGFKSFEFYFYFIKINSAFYIYYNFLT
jgi:hypothetical protein